MGTDKEKNEDLRGLVPDAELLKLLRVKRNGIDVDLGPPQSGTLIEGYLLNGPTEDWDLKSKDGEQLPQRKTWLIAQSRSLKRYVQCYDDDIEAAASSRDGSERVIVRVKPHAVLRYVIAYAATGDDVGDLLEGGVARRHRPGDPDDGDPPTSPKPCPPRSL